MKSVKDDMKFILQLRISGKIILCITVSLLLWTGSTSGRYY